MVTLGTGALGPHFTLLGIDGLYFYRGSLVGILNGAKPRDIPIVANRRWNMYVNPPLLAKARIRLSQDILHKAVKVGG